MLPVHENSSAIYESDALLAQYLALHYGAAGDVLPYSFGPRDALDFPARVVRECVDRNMLPAHALALDLGCAVGRASFELARACEKVIGIDASRRFIATAIEIKKRGHIGYACIDEGELVTRHIGRVPEEIDRRNVFFEVGDAQNLRADLGSFDAVVAANLIDRLADPGLFLRRLPDLVKPSGQLVLTSPYTWTEEFTPRSKWIGGRLTDGENTRTLATLKKMLDPHFALRATNDMPFLIREHARKFQWSVAQATMWIRRTSRA
jgi:putative 4-mercaptohistidine N1-methyltranferase